MRLEKTLLLLASLPSYSLAQTAAGPSAAQAQVTFYSNAVTALGGLPGHQPGAFKGRLFDEGRQLVFMEPGHFITFNMTPGTHVFSATPWTAKHAKSGAHVTVDLVAGEHFFVQALILSNYVGGFRIFLNQVTCEGATQENTHSKPLEPAHLRPDGAPLAVTETVFPKCP